MTTTEAVRDRILHLCEERGLTINRLATICALPPSSIKNILYGKSQNPKLLTIKMLCDGLDITLGEFFSTPEFDVLEQELNNRQNPSGLPQADPLGFSIFTYRSRLRSPPAAPPCRSPSPRKTG